MFKELFCMHNWEKQSEELIPSIINTTKGIKGAMDEIYFLRTHILILSCKKCGKIYKKITKC